MTPDQAGAVLACVASSPMLDAQKRSELTVAVAQLPLSESTCSWPDISDLSPELQSATVDVVASILAVLRAHQNDPERGDVGWRRQDEDEHLDHALGHVDMAMFTNALDDDGLPHEDHALCRLMLVKARRRLG